MSLATRYHPLPAFVEIDCDRRKTPRERCRLTAVIHANGVAQGWGLIYNVSDGGLAIASTKPYRLGTKLFLNVRDGPHDHGVVEVQVCRSEYRPSAGWLLGCSFPDQTPIDTRWLE